MSQSWYVRTSKGELGPFSSSQLRKLVVQGKVRRTSQVSPDKTKWVEASRIRGLEFPQSDSAAKPESASQPNENVDQCEQQAAAATAVSTTEAGPRQDANGNQEFHIDVKVETTEKGGGNEPAGLVAWILNGTIFAVAWFVVIWLFWVINLWPLAFGLTATSNTDPSTTGLGKLASSISASALSSFALYVLVAMIILGILVGIAAHASAEKREPLGEDPAQN